MDIWEHKMMALKLCQPNECRMIMYFELCFMMHSLQAKHGNASFDLKFTISFDFTDTFVIIFTLCPLLDLMNTSLHAIQLIFSM